VALPRKRITTEKPLKERAEVARELMNQLIAKMVHEQTLANEPQDRRAVDECIGYACSDVTNKTVLISLFYIVWNTSRIQNTKRSRINPTNSLLVGHLAT
jgi:hypothetical protein